MKLEITLRVLIKNDTGFLRCIIKNADNKIIFDKTGRTDKLPSEVLEKILTDTMLLTLIEEKIKEEQAIGDIPFVEIKNNLK